MNAVPHTPTSPRVRGEVEQVAPHQSNRDAEVLP